MAVDMEKLDAFIAKFVDDFDAIFHAGRRFSMTEEQAFALAIEASPAYLPGAFQLALGAPKAYRR